MPPSVAIRFASERFDDRSERPAPAHGGHHFCGAVRAAGSEPHERRDAPDRP